MEVSSGILGSARVLRVQGRLDHSHVVYISSVGLRVLLLAAKQVKAQQGRIAIAALSPIVTEVFQVSHFNLVLSVYPDVASAVAGLVP